MNKLPIKIFYAHSTHNDEEFFDDALTHKLTKLGHQLLNVEEQDVTYLIDNIHKAIKSCDIVICNITPDAKQIDNDGKMHLCNNPNVMYEYGYAIAQNKKIITVLNKNKNAGYELPAILRTLRYTDYSDGNNNAIESVCEYIQRHANEEKVNGVLISEHTLAMISQMLRTESDL